MSDETQYSPWNMIDGEHLQRDRLYAKRNMDPPTSGVVRALAGKALAGAKVVGTSVIGVAAELRDRALDKVGELIAEDPNERDQ